MKVFKEITTSLEKQLPFVVYRKPKATAITGFFQKNDKVYYTKDYSESGFVFAPFDNNRFSSVLIPESQSEFVEEAINFNVRFSKSTFFSSDDSRKQHICIVDKAIKAIKNKEFRKVVISRKEFVGVKKIKISEVFKKIVSKYPLAMAYVWFHPKVGLWLGATPETLFKVTQNKFETMSLAGTQVFEGTTNVIWHPKEIDEQQVVTDYICSNLQPISDNITVGSTKTIKAGSLLHLQTGIFGDLKSSISDLIKALHPTPAVCGYPKEKAKQFIIDNEGYNRNFYTGFLGELNLGYSTNLFVNLRCMQIDDNKAIVYVGGGITLGSNSVKEWEETVAKAEVMKQIIN